jgi:hypothetical protein
VWKNINCDWDETQIPERPCGGVAVEVADQQIDVGVRTGLARVQPGRKRRPFQQDGVYTRVAESSGHVNCQAFQRQGQARLPKLSSFRS